MLIVCEKSHNDMIILVGVIVNTVHEFDNFSQEPRSLLYAGFLGLTSNL